MSQDKIQLQLSIINHLLNNAESINSEAKNLEKALKALSELLSTSLIIFTSVYKDQHNNEYTLKHQFYAENKVNDVSKCLITQFQQGNPPPLIKTLYRKQSEVLVKEDEVMSNLFGETKVSRGAGTEHNMAIIPFYNDKGLSGLLGFRTSALPGLRDNYSALFNTIHTQFNVQSQNKTYQLKIETYQTVLDLMPQRVFWKNRQSIYLGCNKAFSDDASLKTPEDIIGVSDHDIFPEQAELYRSDDANTMRTLEHLISSEEPQTHANGNTIWLRTSKRPIIDSEEKVMGVVGTYDDITQLKETQHALKKAKDSLEKRVTERTKELSQTNEKLELAISDLKSTQNQLIENEKMASLGSLVAGIAHEINTPLGVAVTSASHLDHIAKYLTKAVESGQLKKSTFIEKCNELVTSSDLIINNLERASELVKSFKMIAVDQTHDEKRSINLHQYLNKVVHAMTPKLTKKNIRILLVGDEKYRTYTYPGAMSQVMTNLIDNAFIHAFADIYNGEIKIQFKDVGQHLELSVQDNGIGMNEEIQKNIFEPFYTTKRGQGGTGLGLSVVYNLVTQKLGGSIVCQSKLEEWTRFVILIPLKKNHKTA